MTQRQRFKELFTEEIRQNEDIILLVGDVGYKVFDHLREEIPNRVINPGGDISELRIGVRKSHNILNSIMVYDHNIKMLSIFS